MKQIEKVSNQVVGNVGLYYVCYKLSCRGWNVMPTARNARGIDIIAYNKDASRKIAIQVKALSARSPVPLGLSLDNLIADKDCYWVVVCDALKSPSSFVLLPSQVRELAHKGNKEGRISYWLQPKAYNVAEYRERWDLIV